MVPIVEPEVLMDGDHDINRCYEVTKMTLDSVFKELKSLNVKHTGSISIQNVFIEFAKQLGFETEKKGLF